MVFQIDPVTRHERCSDDESDSYPWIGYHRSSIRRGACLALEGHGSILAECRCRSLEGYLYRCSYRITGSIWPRELRTRLSSV